MDADKYTRKLTCAEVRKKLRYEPETGLIYWTSETGHWRVGAGDIAGTCGQYVNVGLNGHKYRAHHLAWLLMTGDWPPRGASIDHKNRNGCDNRWSNLRLATPTQNAQNASLRIDNTSGRSGVARHSNCDMWRAYITANKKVFYLGLFKDFDDAVAAREAAEIEMFKEFAPRQ